MSCCAGVACCVVVRCAAGDGVLCYALSCCVWNGVLQSVEVSRKAIITTMVP